MLVIEPASSLRFSTANFSRTSRLLPRQDSLFVPWKNVKRLSDCYSCTRWNKCVKNGIRASAGELSGPLKPNKKPQRYHPSEDVSDSESDDTGVAVLTPAESCRTIIELNSKAIIMFAGVISNKIQNKLFWPDMPYVTDEHGNIYFQVKNDEDILQILTADDTPVDVIIGQDILEMIRQMQSARAGTDFGDEDIDDEDSDIDDDITDDEEEDEDDEFMDKDWEGVFENKEDEEDFDEALRDWAKLETMNSLHPLGFARDLAKIVSDDPVNYMDQPPAGLAIQGLLKPVFLEENSFINKNMFEHKPNGADADRIGEIVEDKEDDLSVINDQRHELPAQDCTSSDEDLQKDQNLGNGTSYYKLEIMEIRLISSDESQTTVELEDFKRAKPDAIAHSAAKIISRVKSSGDKATLALKSLCWRCKGIQVEEVVLIGVDSLGFDVRVCSERQVQTLRFGFHKRASSEYSAERQLNCLLFPRTGHLQTNRNCDDAQVP